MKGFLQTVVIEITEVHLKTTFRHPAVGTWFCTPDYFSVYG